MTRLLCEGGNAFGDRFFIRGFDARNDVFVDGVRDPGVLVREKRFDLIAEMMGRLAREGELRTRVIEGQRARVERFRATDHERLLREYLAPLLQA